MRQFFQKYYRPGMISLLFLPLFIYPLAKQEYEKKELRAIGFVSPVHPRSSRSLYSYSAKKMEENVLSKATVLDELYLEGMTNRDIDKALHGFSQQTKSTEYLWNNYRTQYFTILFHFSDQTEYQSLINLLDSTIENNLPSYLTDFGKNIFYVFYEHEPEVFAKKYFENDFDICGGVILKKDKPTYYNTLKENFKAYFYKRQRTIYIFFALAILSSFSFWNSFKRF